MHPADFKWSFGENRAMWKVSNNMYIETGYPNKVDGAQWCLSVTYKCNPNQIMLYQISLLLFKTVNENSLTPTRSFVGLMNQAVCSGRQVMFELHRVNRTKIGMNSLENKLYHINKLIVMDKLNWSFPLFKKHMKIQFLKFGNT